MKKAIWWGFLCAMMGVALAGCGSQNSAQNGYMGNGYGSMYPGLSQYGAYGTYGGSTVWIPTEQPPESWTPGQTYYYQGDSYMPPYYTYLNQPQYWQYNQGMGWCYRMH